MKRFKQKIHNEKCLNKNEQEVQEDLYRSSGMYICDL